MHACCVRWYNRTWIFTRNGLVKSTVSIDGFVVESSAITRTPKSAALTIDVFEPVSSVHHEEIAAEGERLPVFAEQDAQSREATFTSLA